MNLIGQVVIHRAFGEGKIIDHDDTYLTISFEQGDKKFQYPDAFRQFLGVKDNTIHSAINQELLAIDEENARRQKQQDERAERVRQKAYKQDEIHIEYVELPAKIGKNKKVYPQKNIAFKCNYCNGGQSSEQVGFNGICSNPVMHNNVRVERRAWCSDPDCDCMRYLEGNINRKDLEKLMKRGGFVCYESQMLRNWTAFAGNVLTGKNKGRPYRLDKVKRYSLCVLTTREPAPTVEGDRYIFAAFLIDETFSGDNREAGYVTTSSEYKIKLSPDEAHSMPFWKYHGNCNEPEKPHWGSGLFRYLDDEESAYILRDIAEIKRGTSDETLAEDFYQYFCRTKEINPSELGEPKGALMLK